MEMESPDRVAESSQRAYARLAGLMYLVVLVFDIGGIAIVSAIQGGGNFLDASHRIAGWEPLYRIGLLLGLVGSLATILLAVGLYVTLKRVDGNLALIALLFRLVEVAGIGTAGFGTLRIYLAANHAGAFDANQLDALANMSSGGEGTYISAIFFSAGSTIFFYLFLKSAYIPRIIAGWGLFASPVYMLAFVGSLIAPRYSGIFLGVGSIPILVAEVSTGLWLLIKGIRLSTPTAAARVPEAVGP
jgi:hypothetical protein